MQKKTKQTNTHTYKPHTHTYMHILDRAHNIILAKKMLNFISSYKYICRLSWHQMDLIRKKLHHLLLKKIFLILQRHKTLCSNVYKNVSIYDNIQIDSNTFIFFLHGYFFISPWHSLRLHGLLCVSTGVHCCPLVAGERATR